MSDKSPDFMEWVLGWRVFKFSANGFCHSMFAEYVWEPGENKAECLIKGGHKAPDEDCHCGFNAYYDYPDWNPTVALVRGRGDQFAIHPDGWRAEYSEILCFVGQPDAVLQRAAKRYDVPIFGSLKRAKAYGKQFGDFFPADRKPNVEAPTKRVVENPLPKWELRREKVRIKDVPLPSEIERAFSFRLALVGSLITVSTIVGAIGGALHVVPV